MTLVDFEGQLSKHRENLINAKPDLYVPEKLSGFYGEIFRGKLSRNRILWGFRDAGAAAAGIPVIEALDQEGMDVFILADGPARDTLEKNPLITDGKLIKNLGWGISHLDHSLSVVGHAVQPDFEQVLTAHARNVSILRRKVPVVWYEDSPPFLGFYKRGLAGQNKLAIPDNVFCFSETSAQQEVGYIPQFEGKTVVTGNPAFDRFADIDVAGIRQRTRLGLGVEDDETWFVWMATKTAATLESCRDFVRGIKALDLKRYRFSARIHPAEAKFPFIKKEYNHILKTLGKHALDTTGYSTDDVGMAADLVGGDTSTAIFEATLNDVRTVTLLIPENMVLRDEWVQELPPDPAIVLDGTSPVVRSKDEVKETLLKVVSDPKTQETLKLKRQVWRSVVGGATERFKNKLLDIAQGG